MDTYEKELWIKNVKLVINILRERNIQGPSIVQRYVNQKSCIIEHLKINKDNNIETKVIIQQ